MNKAIKIIHFHNGSGGGVLSVIRNLLEHQQHAELENHVIYTINKNKINYYEVPGLKGAVTEKVFYYSQDWNFYYTCSKLAKLIPDKKAIIVAHDWLELGMVSNLGLPNPVVHMVHGDYEYYYDLAKKHEAWIDKYICIAGSIEEKLKILLDIRLDDICYLRFPVPDINIQKSKNDIKQIAFIGRCEAAKGFFLLPQIDKILLNENLEVGWHIVGEGSELSQNQEIWPDKSRVNFYGKITQQKLHLLLGTIDIMVLPSSAEGMPLSVIEAMKAGVIPIVNDIPGGIQEIIQNGKTGFRLKGDRQENYVQIIKKLIKNDAEMSILSQNAIAFANKFFSPTINARNIEDVLLSPLSIVEKKSKRKIYGSRLDSPNIPNVITNGIRRFRRFMSAKNYAPPDDKNS